MPIYHICAESDRADAVRSGQYRAASLEREGFIHCSHLAQVLEFAERHHAGRKNLLLLVIDPDRVTAEVKNEPSRNGELFPHIYGPLNTDAILSAPGMATDGNGRFVLPDFELIAEP